MHVCLSRSSSLAKKGAYVIVLSREDRLLFEGCLEFQILVGLLSVHGYTLTPSHTPTSLFSPSSSPRLPLLPLDPHCVHDTTVRLLVEGLCQPAVRFTSQGDRLNPEATPLDLGKEDVEWINSLGCVTVACVLVVWNLDSPLLSGLQSIPHSIMLEQLPLTGQTTPPTFRLLDDKQPRTGILCMPEVHTERLNDILDYRGAVVLVCGDVNTGKSTVCRFIINSLLNRYTRVGFLECDVGQTEFTVSMVTALHVLTRPVFGPSYTDQRKPYKAFYYGHPSPADKPHYYVCLIQQLYTLFMSELHDNGEVPLVINTCGWTTDMGVAILMDIIRLTSPSHLIRMVADTDLRTYQPLTNLLPFTPHTLTSTPGIITHPTPLPPSVEEEWRSTITPSVVSQHQSDSGHIPNHTLPTLDHIATTLGNSETTADHNDLTPKHRETTPTRGETIANCRETTPTHRSTTSTHGETTPIHGETTPTHRETIHGSDSGCGDEVCIDLDDSCEPECNVEMIACQPSPPQVTSSLPTHTPSLLCNLSRRKKGRRITGLPHKRGRNEGSSQLRIRSRFRSKSERKLVSRKPGSKVNRMRSLSRSGLSKLPGQLSEQSPPTVTTTVLLQEHWLEVESCMLENWVKVLEYNVTMLRAAPAAVRSRRSSSLMRRLALVAHFSPLISGCGDHTHFLESAPVLQVSWSDVAIHVIHKQVPRGDVMSAMRGNYVALCNVDPNEVVEEGGGTVRFLRSHTPIITFLAMGVFRGSSSEKQLYYVTTPLINDPVAMDNVNVLVMGTVEPSFGFTETTPTTFHHIPTGQFAWKGQY